ncbi:uncharacterized protein LOC129756159 [Uranotaenia lowii]|uniref:uncharacterized protein LOC129756159 n=1 Tax=Uranotaenia lowii TaxID=190385 RepID=UPI00247A7E25|nr:uncharacterized protein LOC129756159 [Uranotaenia lowii]
MKSSTAVSVTCMVLLGLTLASVANAAKSAPKSPTDAATGPVLEARAFPSLSTVEYRGAYASIPPMGQSIEDHLRLCEIVIHALESELPRKSVFRSLFLDKVRLSSGFDKQFRFSYYDIIKNRIDDTA